jgi:vacuolar-type H+-ATPase subunit I/STV1
MNQVKIQGTSFVRDTTTKALINTNIVEIENYNKKVLMVNQEKDEINKVKSEIQTIKDDMTEIKSLMLKLLEKGSNV